MTVKVDPPAGRRSRILGFSVCLAETGYERRPPPVPSLARLSCGEKMPSSVWLFFPARGAESLLLFQEKVHLPPNGLSPCAVKPVSLSRLL